MSLELRILAWKNEDLAVNMMKLMKNTVLLNFKICTYFPALSIGKAWEMSNSGTVSTPSDQICVSKIISL